MSGAYDHLAEDVGMSSEEFAEVTGTEAAPGGERGRVERDLALSDQEYDESVRDPQDVSGPAAPPVG